MPVRNRRARGPSPMHGVGRGDLRASVVVMTDREGVETEASETSAAQRDEPWSLRDRWGYLGGAVFFVFLGVVWYLGGGYPYSRFGPWFGVVVAAGGAVMMLYYFVTERRSPCSSAVHSGVSPLPWPLRWRVFPWWWWQARIMDFGMREQRVDALDVTGERTPAWRFGDADSRGARIELTHTGLRTYRGDELRHDLAWDAITAVEACRHNPGGEGRVHVTIWVRLHVRPPVGAGRARRVLPYLFPAIDHVDLWPSTFDADPRALFWACTEFLDPARRAWLLGSGELATHAQ